MRASELDQLFRESINNAQAALLATETYVQLAAVIACLAIAYLSSRGFRSKALEKAEARASADSLSMLKLLQVKFLEFIAKLIFPALTILLLKASILLSESYQEPVWLLKISLLVSSLVVVYIFIGDAIKGTFAANFIRWTTLPLLFLHLVDVLPAVIALLESISITLGNLSISAYGILRALIFGALVFWLGRVSNNAGKNVIRKQKNLDVRTKEVSAKLFELVVFFVGVLLFLQIMGINITTLAVFGGALGVGLGFGLQAIASNFISGLIILLDRSLSVGDYVEFEEGMLGIVREMNLRSTTLETFDGKDIVVPNEKFITQTFVNWTHKDTKQRYRVDFSVSYDADIHKLVPLIKDAVGTHPQVMSDPSLPIEELPDCEIDSFGDSGINMFVEFWMEGIDDGKNRVGGDLLLLILDTLRENGFVIPFPQREVRVLDSPIKVTRI